MITALTILAVLSGAPPTPAGNAAEVGGAPLSAIDKAFLTAVEKQRIPGAAIGIVIDGKLAYLKTAGVRDVATNAPVTPETRFRIASMTKSFTAAGILKLRDEGKLSLDDPVSKYIPELAKLSYPTKDAPVITIRHLLTHSEGFPEDNPWGDRQMAQTNAAMDSWMRAGIPFSNAPGVAYEYSNYGFAILGRIIERVAGRPYDEYIRDAIFKPLGMTSSTFKVEEVPKEHIAYGYRWEGSDKPQLVLQPPLAHGSFGAMGGLWTTAGDLAKWVAFQLSAFPPRDDPETGPIRRASAREMQQMSRFAGASASRANIDAPLQMTASGYGYGLRISRDCRFDHVVGHGGGLPGYGSYMQWLPDYGFGIISFGNLTYTSLRNVQEEVLDTLRMPKRAPRPAPALLAMKDDVSSLITKWDQRLADRIAADNFFMDDSGEVRSKRLSDILAKHGACRDAQPIEAENALRGQWRMTCDRGWVQVGITLAPTQPPRLQFLNVRSVLPPDDATLKRIEPLLAASAHPQWGTCRIGEPFDNSTVILNCDRGNMHARITAEKIELAPARDKPCVP